MGPTGLTTFMSLSEGQQILVLAQILYGYGYSTSFAFEYEKSVPECGLFEYEQVCYQLNGNFMKQVSSFTVLLLY